MFGMSKTQHMILNYEYYHQFSNKDSEKLKNTMKSNFYVIPVP